MGSGKEVGIGHSVEDILEHGLAHVESKGFKGVEPRGRPGAENGIGGMNGVEGALVEVWDWHNDSKNCGPPAGRKGNPPEARAKEVMWERRLVRGHGPFRRLRCGGRRE